MLTLITIRDIRTDMGHLIDMENGVEFMVVGRRFYTYDLFRLFLGAFTLQAAFTLALSARQRSISAQVPSSYTAQIVSPA